MLDYRLANRSPWSQPAADADSRRRRYVPVWRHLCELRCQTSRSSCDDIAGSFPGSPDDSASELDWALASAVALMRQYWGGSREASAEEHVPKELLKGLSYYELRPACLILWGYPKDLVGTLLNVSTVTVYSVLECMEKPCRPKPVPRWTLDDLAIERRSSGCLKSRDLERLCYGAFDDEERQRAERHVEVCPGCLQNLVLVEEMGYLLRVGSS